MPEAPDLINLGFLSDSERELILEVLRRDEELRMVEDQRVRKLQKELLEVKRKGAKHVSGNYSERSCGRMIIMFHVYINSSFHASINVCVINSRELKKRTGDWFYNQRVNRFSMNPGHTLVRASLKKRPAVKKRETTAEKLLRDAEKISPPSKPVPLPRQNPPGKTDFIYIAPIHETHHLMALYKVKFNQIIQIGNFFYLCVTNSKPVHTSCFQRNERCQKCDFNVFMASQEDQEEEEDIDRLVNFHKMSMLGVHAGFNNDSPRLFVQSMMSIYSESGDFDSVEVKGDVVFSVKYDEHTQCLHVFIKQCRDLAYGDAARLLSNPYVKCYLLPDKSRQSKKKTSVKKNNVNPVYGETLKYSIRRSELATRCLLISVWHNSLLGRNAFLGEVEVPLDCRDLESGPDLILKAYLLYKGELVISLKYVTPKKTTSKKAKGKKAPSEEGGELHVLIKEAKNLVPIKPGGTSDSFVKGYLFPAKAKDAKRKTAVMKKNLNPQYNATFVYEELSLEQLGGMCLELTVWDRGAKLSNEFLGGVRLSSGKGKEEVKPESGGEEISLWQKMMQYPDSWAEGTLPLRCTMGKTKGK
uniref:Synaptotagmin-like 4 n=1 Tax=Fundulus heteroclitus TaxID=8078 RepID=A0A3Q2PQB6_FUNHE